MSDNLEGLLKTLTPLQRAWVRARLLANTDVEASRAVGIDQGTPYKWANLADCRRCVELAEGRAFALAQDELNELTLEAVAVLRRELRNPSPRGHAFEAALAVLDRVLGKPTERVQVDTAATKELAALMAGIRAALPEAEDVQPVWQVEAPPPPSGPPED